MATLEFSHEELKLIHRALISFSETPLTYAETKMIDAKMIDDLIWRFERKMQAEAEAVANERN